MLGDPDTDLEEAAIAGLKTVQLLSRYDRAVIIDCTAEGCTPVGHVRRVPEEELGGGCGWLSHGVNLRLALNLARGLSLPLPQEVFVYVICVRDTGTFGEQLTAEVEQALPAAADRIADELRSDALPRRAAGFKPRRKRAAGSIQSWLTHLLPKSHSKAV